MIGEKVMKILNIFWICLVLGVFSSPSTVHGAQGFLQQSQSAPAPISNRDVVEMLKIGLSPEVVAAKIGNTNCKFDTSVRELENLRAAGTPDLVLLAMVRAPSPQSDPKPARNDGSHDFIPLWETLPWPILVLLALILWQRQISRLFVAVVQRVESGAQIEAGGVVLREPPDETYEPFPRP